MVGQKFFYLVISRLICHSPANSFALSVNPELEKTGLNQNELQDPMPGPQKTIISQPGETYHCLDVTLL